MTIEIPGFRIQQLIAEGGMATVYLAEQESLARLVALKVLKHSGSDRDTERFLHEGRVIASLNHRSIITIHDIGSHGQHRFLSMEYHERGSLQALLEQGIAADAALDLVQTIAECLEFVHQRGIVHRDIKPGNILIRRDGTPVLTDFGVAKDVMQDRSLTMDGLALGSPYYLSPEQALGRTPDCRADLYSLGVVLFELLTGRRPFEGETAMEVIVAHVSQRVPRLPQELSIYQPLIDGLLAKSPDERFGCAETLIQEITRTRDAIQASARVRPANNALMRWVRGPTAPRGYAVVAIVLGVSVAALGFGVLGDSSHSASAPAVTTAAKSSVDPGTGDDDPGPNNPSSKVSSLGLDLVAPDDTIEPSPASYQRSVAVPADSRAAAAPANQDRAQHHEQIEAYLARAETALKRYHLTTPLEDNAYHYYSKALKLDPEHPVARRGMDRIANSYGDLAQAAIERYEYEQARRYLDRGLAVDPANERLLALRGRTKAFKDIPFRLRRQLDAWF